MNTPKIRFPDFNNEYNDIVFSTIANKISKRNKENNITNVISNSALHGLISQREFFDKNIANNDNTENYYIIEKNDFVYNPRKSNQAPYGPINLYKYDTPGVISPLYLCFKTKNNDPNYLEYYFKSSCWHRYIYLNGDSGARHDRVSIRDDVFFNMNIKIPSKEEQLKIANFLSLLDKKIELQSRKIEDLKLFKKGLSATIFNNSKDLKEYKLGKICDITTGKLDANAMVENGKYRFYTCAKEYSFIDKYAFDTEALLISGNGAYVGYIHYYKGKFNAYQRTYVLNNFTQNIQFIKCYLEQNLSKRINSEKKEGNTPYIVLSTLADMTIKTPSKEDQIKISNIINYCNSKINLEKDKLLKLQELKKGLMQSMFV